MTGILTVLHCAAAGARATKTYGPDPEDPGRYVLRKGYDAGTKFRAAELPYDRIDDLAGHFGWLAGEPRKLIIPGRLTALGRERIANGQVVYRRSVTDPVCFEEQPFGFLFSDTDGLELPAGVDETGEEALAILEEASPPDLRGASHTRHFSSSAGLGIKPGLRVHRAWALARPYTAAELTAYAEEANEKAGAALFDPAVFRPVQPIYTADTVFEGCPDPLAGKRSAFVRGDRDAVELTIPVGRVHQVRWFGPRARDEAELERDDDGKLKDDREEGSRAARLEALKRLPETPEEFVELAWAIFRERFSIGPNTQGNSWSFDKFERGCPRDWHRRAELVEKYGRTGRKPVPGGEPEFPAPNPVPLAVAQEAARKLFADYFARPRDLVIRGGVGLGKTELAAEALAAPPPGAKVAYYAPAHVNLNDVAKRIGERNPAIKVVVVQPRNEETCSKWEHVEPVAEKGGLVGPVLCGRKPAEEEPGDEPAPACKSSCANRLVCGYWLQFEEPAQVYLFATEQLRFEPQEGLPKFDYIIVDEAFWQTFVQHVDVELAELLALRDASGDEVERALRRAIWEALTDREAAARRRAGGVGGVRRPHARGGARGAGAGRCRAAPLRRRRGAGEGERGEAGRGPGGRARGAPQAGVRLPAGGGDARGGPGPAAGGAGADGHRHPRRLAQAVPRQGRAGRRGRAPGGHRRRPAAAPRGRAPPAGARGRARGGPDPRALDRHRLGVAEGPRPAPARGDRGPVRPGPRPARRPDHVPRRHRRRGHPALLQARGRSSSGSTSSSRTPT